MFVSSGVQCGRARTRSGLHRFLDCALVMLANSLVGRTEMYLLVYSYPLVLTGSASKQDSVLNSDHWHW